MGRWHWLNRTRAGARGYTGWSHHTKQTDRSSATDTNSNTSGQTNPSDGFGGTAAYFQYSWHITFRFLPVRLLARSKWPKVSGLHRATEVGPWKWPPDLHNPILGFVRGKRSQEGPGGAGKWTHQQDVEAVSSNCIRVVLSTMETIQFPKLLVWAGRYGASSNRQSNQTLKAVRRVVFESLLSLHSKQASD